MNDKSKAPNFLGLIDENNQISLSDYKGSFLAVSYTHLRAHETP